MSPAVLGQLRARPLKWAGLAAILVVGEATFLNKKGDLWIYTRAAGRMVVGEPIYRPDEGNCFSYPPFFALPFTPMIGMPEMGQRTVWFVVNAAALAIILALLRKLLAPTLEAHRAQGPPAWLFCVLAAAIAFVHVSAPFEGLTHDLLIFLSVTLAVYASCRSRDSLSGTFAGLGAACKVTPLLFGLVFLWQRRRAGACSLVLGMTAASVIPDLLYPAADGKLWVVRWYEAFGSKAAPGQTACAQGAWGNWNHLNQSLAGLLYRLATRVPTHDWTPGGQWDVSLIDLDRPTLTGITLMAQAGTLLLILWGMRPALSCRLSGQDLALRRLGEGALVSCGMVLLSPMSSKPHFCVLLLSVCFCLAHSLYRKPDLIANVLLFVVFAMGWLTNKDLVPKSLGDEMQARGSITICALACLAATYGILARRPGKNACPTPSP